MQQTLMQQGFDLLIYGMGTVFMFLAILVVVTSTMSSIIRRFFPEADPITLVVGQQPPQAAPASVSPQITAAIKAAIEQHRDNRR